MARIRSARGTARKMMMRPTGTIIAPPTPCTKRAKVNSSRLVEAAHISEPTTKMPIAVRNTERAP